MRSKKAVFAKSILIEVEIRLGLLSFFKQNDALLKPLDQDASGWINFNVSTNHPSSRVGLSLFVGVLYSPIEDLVRRLCRQPFPYGPTISVALGYLTPEARFLEWIFSPEINTEEEIGKIILATKQYALPFMSKHTTLESIITELEAKRYTVNDLRRFRLPAAYLLANQKERSLELIKAEENGLGARTDPAALQFRDFAQAFTNHEPNPPAPLTH